MIGRYNFNMFSDPFCRYTGPTGGSGYNRLVDICFNEMFSEPLCMYTGGSGFNPVGLTSIPISESLGSYILMMYLTPL